MTPPKAPDESRVLKSLVSSSFESFPDGTVSVPGLSVSAESVDHLVKDLVKKLAVLSYKENKGFVWVVLMGGTGTGKSTIFNTLCGQPVSETGVERPKTHGPIIYTHRDVPVEEDFPFASFQTKRVSSEGSSSTSFSGTSGQLLIVEHSQDELSHLVLVDTPDLDSLETRNRQAAEDLYLLSDSVVFITSQEKYADEVLYQFLRRVYNEEKPYFFLLNKADALLTREEVLISFSNQELQLEKDKIWLLPYAPSYPFQWLLEYPKFWDFVDSFRDLLSKDQLSSFLQEQKRKRIEQLQKQIHSLIELLDKEKNAARKWIHQLDELFQTISRDLLEEQKTHFTQESRQYLQTEIRALFSKYDLFAKPRRVISQVIKSPLRLLGFSGKPSQQSHREDLRNIRQKIDLTPIEISVEKLNRAVLEKLSPSDNTSPLYKKLHRLEIMLTEDEIKDLVWKEQERLFVWLEETFQELTEDIPKGKKWGIYSTSILWGALILSFEAAVGGGISALEATLDSILAPFVTKGAVELFAYQEIEKIGRELADRYQEGLVSVLRQQRDRYEECLQSLMPLSDMVTRLQSLEQTLKTSS